MTGPSYSPENQFSVDGKHYFLSLSNTCDVILVRELLEDYRKAIDVLKETSSFRMELQNRRAGYWKHYRPIELGKKDRFKSGFMTLRSRSQIIGILHTC